MLAQVLSLLLCWNAFRGGKFTRSSEALLSLRRSAMWSWSRQQSHASSPAHLLWTHTFWLLPTSFGNTGVPVWVKILQWLPIPLRIWPTVSPAACGPCGCPWPHLLHCPPLSSTLGPRHTALAVLSPGQALSCHGLLLCEWLTPAQLPASASFPWPPRSGAGSLLV